MKKLSVSLTLFLVVICACKAGTQPAHSSIPLTSMDAPQGGKIVFGTVDGAATQAEAMGKVLRIVHTNCGDKPQVGKIFQFKGTHTLGVFFTVTNHAQNNTPVAGLVISAVSGPHQVEAALVSDRASRFGQTVNPMLQQLFSRWSPGGQAAASSSAFGGTSARAGGGEATSGPARLHTVVLRDNSASVGLPDGWRLDPGSGGGSIGAVGPNGERVFLNSARSAVDPNDPQVRSLARFGSLNGNQGQVVYPFNADLTQAYPEVIRRWRHAGGIDAPVHWQNPHAERMTAQRGENCVHISGNIVDDSKTGSNETNLILCNQNYQQGNYLITIFQTLIPVELADRERSTAGAIMASFQVNQAVVAQQANAYAAPAIAVVHAIGAQAAADRASRNESYDAQHKGYWAQQENNAAQHSQWSAGQDTQARNNQGFSNYLLDQSVVQDNNMYNNGTVGHGTVWNSTADALVKADPNRFETVSNSNFWQGIDY